VEAFVMTSSMLGYSRSTVRERLRVLADLEQWLKRKRLVLVDLQEQVVQRFLEKRRRTGRLRNSDARTVHHFLEHLRGKGIIPSTELPIDRSPLATLQKQYEAYLRKERGLAPVTIGRYWHFLRHFLVERFGEGPICLREIAPDDISGFLLRHARSGSPGAAKLMVSALRSFFRFLFRNGEIERDLAGAVPTVPAWRHAELPRHLEGNDVERVVQACDRSTSVGRRDYAILLLLARLGLRAPPGVEGRRGRFRQLSRSW
jgi:site-specific recombinase XerD